jgi:hypothetical protein
MCLHVAVAISIDETELQRVHSNKPGKLVHLHFDGEVRDGDTEAAHGARWCPVRVDAIAIDLDVRNGVGPREMGCRFLRTIGRMPRIGARIDVAADLAGDDPSVFHQAVFDVDALGRARR